MPGNMRGNAPKGHWGSKVRDLGKMNIDMDSTMHLTARANGFQQ